MEINPLTLRTAKEYIQLPIFQNGRQKVHFLANCVLLTENILNAQNNILFILRLKEIW